MEKQPIQKKLQSIADYPGGTAFLTLEYLSYGIVIFSIAVTKIKIGTLSDDAWSIAFILARAFLLMCQLYVLRDLKKKLSYGNLLYALRFGLYYLIILTYGRSGLGPIMLTVGYQILMTVLLDGAFLKSGPKSIDAPLTPFQYLFAKYTPIIMTVALIGYLTVNVFTNHQYPFTMSLLAGSVLLFAGALYVDKAIRGHDVTE